MSHPATAPVDPHVFREVMGHYPTGVVVVTGRDSEGDILAMVVGTFNSVSLDPPLVSFMPMMTSRTFAKMRECSSLCINILGGEQEDIVLTIAQRWENKLDGIEWFPSPSGDPVLSESIAWIDTTIWNTVEAGDHWIVLCRVNDMAVANPVSPLIFFQGGYGSFVSTSLMARMDHEILPAIHAAHGARAEVEALANSIGCEVSVFTAVSCDEMATVLSATGVGVDREEGLAHRVPMVPPIGDSYVFSRPIEEQERWVDKLREASADVKDMHRMRLEFVREHGYLLSFLPVEGSAAYDEMRDATKRYEKGRLTPSQERNIRESIGRASVDYRVREVDEQQVYDVGSIVLPVRDPAGEYSLTLRLGQLPPQSTGSTINNWLDEARAVVRVLEAG
ncbi:flavin reductase (DIM6/NTAB) family NADH-FMN oxidoreductase RutF [Williamsia muralis]|uniref:Flavin reductase (DIM6/NTAB) family NADH-FMN oxidoreductase RutF n=1 Tax=Williamsia marianensis TaxID=85044 RepID=A0A495K863_WILMA|nr:flavin reductase family protein [Williamsia muralis]MDV7134677.1 flavin reductase family protein [Williamsia muralis]RKR96798.1 flavin reductase (DIM6/NTAB) family NADH-FMN oxidoreductase RutF [Williamsia muralis]